MLAKKLKLKQHMAVKIYDQCVVIEETQKHNWSKSKS